MRSADIRVESIEIPMRDGPLLKADLFIKDDNLRRFTLLQRTPYGRESSASLINAVDLARQGWAVVIQNIRGRADSEGDFLPFLQEQDDGLDTLNWIASQPWSNGKVAMSGTSYCGYAQWSSIYGMSKNLGAISPQLTTSNVLEHWFYENKLFRQAFAQSWGLSLAHTDEQNKKQKREIIELAKNLLNLYHIPPQKSPLKKFFPPYRSWLNSKDNVYWKKISGANKSTNTPIPAFHLTGWYDIFCEGALQDYKILHESAVLSKIKNQRLIIGPWGHNTLFQHRVGQLNFGYEADGFTQDTMQEIHSWLHNALSNQPLKSGASIFVMGANKWEELSTWPPSASETETMNLYLSVHERSGKKVLERIPSSENHSFVIDETALKRPIFLGGRTLDPASLDSGPYDHSSVLGTEGDVLFVFPPLKQSLTVMGEIFTELFIKSKKSSIDLSLTIFDKHQDGPTYNIVTQSHNKECIPNKINKIILSVGNTAIKFKEGHSICLRVTVPQFPHVIGPNFFNQDSESEVFFGKDFPSHLSLPVQTI